MRNVVAQNIASWRLPVFIDVQCSPVLVVSLSLACRGGGQERNTRYLICAMQWVRWDQGFFNGVMQDLLKSTSGSEVAQSTLAQLLFPPPTPLPTIAQSLCHAEVSTCLPDYILPSNPVLCVEEIKFSFQNGMLLDAQKLRRGVWCLESEKVENRWLRWSLRSFPTPQF